jgi:hypothetical protein
LERLPGTLYSVDITAGAITGSFATPTPTTQTVSLMSTYTCQLFHILRFPKIIVVLAAFGRTIKTQISDTSTYLSTMVTDHTRSNLSVAITTQSASLQAPRSSIVAGTIPVTTFATGPESIEVPKRQDLFSSKLFFPCHVLMTL